MPQVELLFLGTGTSAGVPMIGCHCEVCTSRDPHDTRTRPSVVISYDKTRVLVDTTPELRMQCLANDVHWIDAVVYTHSHSDHVMGMDDLRRFNMVSGRPLEVWASDETMKVLRTSFGYAFREPDPTLKVSRPHFIARSIEGPFEINAMRWTPIPLIHGDVRVLGFRVGDLAYCTDVSEIPEASYELLKGVDVLVLGALQFKKHPTHFTVEEALRAVERIKPRQAFFTHIAHGMSHEAGNAALPPHVRLGYDGLRIKTK